MKGTITTPHDTLQDEVILRGDGMPLYNFGAVVDDVTMEINLVARGDDHVNNTARQILIYQALGYPVPAFAHLPMILGADKTRLSKRHGATNLMSYRDMGFLPQALVNYLVRLGWSHGDQEIFTHRGAGRGLRLEAGRCHRRRLQPRQAALGEPPVAARPLRRRAGRPARSPTSRPPACRRPTTRSCGSWSGSCASGPRASSRSSSRRATSTPPSSSTRRRAPKHLTAEARPLLRAVRDGVAGMETMELPALEKLFAEVAAAAGARARQGGPADSRGPHRRHRVARHPRRGADPRQGRDAGPARRRARADPCRG